MHRITAFFAALLLTSQLAVAQTYPDPQSTTVNDFAGMLSEEAEARVAETLTDLERDTGVEATVVTLSSVRFYANDLSVADYATELFNAWGVGDADKGDGVLLIVFRDDKELRLELGTGYDSADQDTAQDIVSGTIVPQFVQNNFEAGIEAGAVAISDQLVREPAAAPSGEGGGNTLWYILGGVVAAGLAVFGLNKRAKAKLAATPCPSCGVAGHLSKDNAVLVEATETTEGEGERRTTCGKCGHVTREAYTISKKRAEDKKPAFKGGKSDGDGASGKW